MISSKTGFDSRLNRAMPHRRQQRNGILSIGIKTPLSIALACLLTVWTTDLLANESRISLEKINSLVRQLDASTLADRTRAERELLDLGTQVLRLLPAPELIESIPIRESVRRIRVQLERRAAKESSGPSRVSLTGELSLRNIVEQIQQQTENHLAFEDIPAKQLDQQMAVKWDQQTFWNCLDDLCERLRLSWQFSKDSTEIRLSGMPETANKPRAIQRSGPFRLAIDQIEIRAIVGNPRQRLMRVQGHVSIEPRLRPLFLTIAASELKAVGDSAIPIEQWNPDARHEHPVLDNRREVSVTWDFSLSEPITVKNLSINGRIHCQIAASTERVIFDQTSLEGGTIRRRGGISVRLRDVLFKSIDPEHLDANIGVAVSYDQGGPAFESHRTWILHNSAFLETKNGSRFDFNDFETNQQSDGAVSVDYRWKNLAAPANQYQFVYEAPMLILDVPLDVELSKISIDE